MQQPALNEALSPADLETLRRARLLLEKTNFAMGLAAFAGRPVNHILRMMPKALNDRLAHTVEASISKGLDVAIKLLELSSKRPPAKRLSLVLAGLSGGVSGLVGFAALPVELPLTTILMLRAIADIARHQGEDLSTIEGRLACVEVFGLSDRGSDGRMGVGYYASRALLGKFTRDASAFLSERGVANASAPVVDRLVTEVASRFGGVVSERAAASAVPIAGALGGATVNLVFMNHFRNIARGHFIVRRLERRYGAEVVRQNYARLAHDADLRGHASTKMF